MIKVLYVATSSEWVLTTKSNPEVVLKLGQFKEVLYKNTNYIVMKPLRLVTKFGTVRSVLSVTATEKLLLAPARASYTRHVF